MKWALDHDYTFSVALWWSQTGLIKCKHWQITTKCNQKWQLTINNMWNLHLNITRQIKIELKQTNKEALPILVKFYLRGNWIYFNWVHLVWFFIFVVDKCNFVSLNKSQVITYMREFELSFAYSNLVKPISCTCKYWKRRCEPGRRMIMLCID